MKVTNWRRKLIKSLVAAGALVPSASYALDIPLGDPSFEAYVVPARGYAYAAEPFGAYRPTSPWVDDLDSPPGFTQDNGASNWIYNATYAEPPGSVRPAPRTGSQAMHGLDGQFNAQELVNVFEANKTYTFAVWAQNDVTLDQGNGIAIYVFDGNVPFNPFSPTGTLANSPLFTDVSTPIAINHRTAAMTAAQSQANWNQLTITHTVVSGAPEIGHPIGVAFRAFRDSAVDDASLTVEDAVTQVLFLEVNTTNGTTRLRNQTGAPVNIDYYEVNSAGNRLNATAWNSLQEQNLAGFPAGNGSGNGWEQAGGSNSSVIGESYLTGTSAVVNGANINLGAAFVVGGPQDLTFKYGANLSVNPPQTGDYNNNGVVDGADYVLWRNGGPLANDPTPGVQPADYNAWRANFGAASGPAGPSTLVTGAVIYVTSASAVPEPTSVLLVGMGIALVAAVNWRTRPDAYFGPSK
jgi:hypothetical protein